MSKPFRDRFDPVAVAVAGAAVSSFYPTDAVVILSVVPESGRVVAGARADLAGFGDELPEALRAVVADMPDAGALVVAVFGAWDKARQASEALAADLLSSVRVHLVLACTDDGVFVEEGGEFVQVSPVPLHKTVLFDASEAVGVVTRRTRADVLRSHQPLEEAASSVLAGPIVRADLRVAALGSAAAVLDEATALVGRVRSVAGAVSDEDAALLGALCLTGPRRDALLAAIDLEDAEAVAEALRRVAVRLSGPDAVPVLAVCGLAYWISGSGDLAGVVVEIAQGFEVPLSLVGMVDHLRSSPVMNPRKVWPELQARTRAAFE